MEHAKKKQVSLTLDEYLVEDLGKISMLKGWTLSFTINLLLTDSYNDLLEDYRIKELLLRGVDNVKVKTTNARRNRKHD